MAKSRVWQSDPCEKTGPMRNREVHHKIYDEGPRWFKGDPGDVLHFKPGLYDPSWELSKMVFKGAIMGRNKNNKIRP